MLLGLFALRYAPVVRALRQWLRLVVIERGHRRLVGRARCEQHWLLQRLREVQGQEIQEELKS
jgi:hypothetical protein